MSGATFSQPTSPTTGLQGYDLERRVRNLVPGTGFAALLTRRTRRRRRPPAQPTMMMKDTRMNAGTFQSMTQALAKSVGGIVTAGEDVEALLAKSFSEFGESLERQVGEALSAREEELAKAAPPMEGPLYKGMGTVGRVADFVAAMAKRIDAINDGVDFQGQEDDDGKDEPSDLVKGYLEHALSAGELALRQAVNEHVSIADDDDGDEGTMFVKSADGSQEFRVRVNGLPEDLAKFACAPSDIDARLVEDAAGVLVAFGADERGLAKAFEDGGLAKAFPPRDGAPQGAADGAGQPDDGGEDPGADQGGDPDGGMEDPVEAIHVLGRLLAAAMIQTDGIARMFEGGGEAQADPDAEQGADPAAQAQAPAPPPPPGGMRKLADATVEFTDDPRVEALEKSVSDLKGMLAKVLASPSVPRAVLGDAGRGSLNKQADAAGSGDVMTAEEVAEELTKMSPDDRTRALYRLSRGTAPETVLGRG